MTSTKLVHLECARGIASVIVVFHHFTQAFFPALKDNAWSTGGLKFTPFYVLINGEGAVVFFFILSGFVLTLRFHAEFSLERWAAAVLKRLPRLVVPAGASILLGYLILRLGGRQHELAAAASGSQWLRDFGNAYLPPGLEPTLADAIRQSLFVFLVPRDFYYNANLWTMFAEFYGSLLVFLTVLLGSLVRSRRALVVTVMHVALIAAALLTYRPFAPFLIGSWLAFAVTQRRDAFALPGFAKIALVLIALAGFSTTGGVAILIGATCCMLLLIGDSALAARLSGRMGALLGALSFPLYLVHTLVILSVGSFVFAQLTAAGAPVAATGTATLAATLSVCAVLSLPFMKLDIWWTSWLNTAVKSPVASLFAATRRRGAR